MMAKELTFLKAQEVFQRIAVSGHESSAS